MTSDMDSVLKEQIAYYRARASEYDEAYDRINLYDRGEEANRRWISEMTQLETRLDGLGIRGRVLEIACGTGKWTQQLGRTATELVALDASPEMIALARQRTERRDVEFVEANIFDWSSEELFDAVFFAFWLTHVPDDRFDAFWNTVRNRLKPEGFAFFIDDLGSYESIEPARRRRVQPREFNDGTILRRLNDGRVFRIVKVPRRLEELTRRLEALGWQVELEPSGSKFYSGLARPKRFSYQG